jgi:mono/diheme cytochrome c family protein
MAHLPHSRLLCAVLAGALCAATLPAAAQHSHTSTTPSPGAAQHAHPAASPATGDMPMGHGTPKDWKFTLPKGDPGKGRAVFEKLECYSCHEVRGESFPAPTIKASGGPELAQMGPMHPPEFFAESVVNPSAVVDPEYRAPDGSSRMPAYNDEITVQELIDLVAYLAALRPPADAADVHKH